MSIFKESPMLSYTQHDQKSVSISKESPFLSHTQHDQKSVSIFKEPPMLRNLQKLIGLPTPYSLPTPNGFQALIGPQKKYLGGPLWWIALQAFSRDSKLN
jgi:hypothetical protein